MTHDNVPHEITHLEWNELFPLIGEMWGADNAEDLAIMAYGVRFNFISGGPGYTGDLFIIAGDVIEAPCVLTRGDDGKLRLAD